MYIGGSLVKRLLAYLLAGIMFGLFYTLFLSLLLGSGYMIGFFQDSAILGGSFAILFGLFMEIVKIGQAKKFKNIKLEIAQTNTIIFDSAANYLKGAKNPKSGIAGWLFLTKENLIFKTYKLDMKSHEMIIPINEIQRIDKFKVYGLSLTTNAIILNFGVDNRNKWFDLINSRLTNNFN